VTRSTFLAVLPPTVLFLVALVVRLDQHHAALLYPDGYQYLLMARGIGEHLQPTTVLGPGGDGFAPSPDAAAKPLFPLLVAAVHAVGVSWLDAARVVTAAAGASAVTALALLVGKLSGSRIAGLAAGLLLLASPSLGLWSGFSGPDPLAQALVLTAALAFVHRRSRLGGLVTGLAIATRPELVLVAGASGAVALRGTESRRALGRAAPVALVTGALVFSVLRTPIELPDWRLVSLVPLILGAAALAAIAPVGLLRYAAILGLGLVTLGVVTRAGPAEVWSHDWWLLVLGLVGFVVLLLDRRRSPAAMLVLAGVLLLGVVYVVKNPASGRYFSLLLPGAALLAGLAIPALPRWARPVGITALLVGAGFGFLHPAQGNRNHDMFPVVAEEVASQLDSAALVTAAPDAYGFWLPNHTVRAMRPGARGAVLLDATQRLYESDLTARGRVLARVADEIAFAGPDLEIDADPAVLVSGQVVIARGPRDRREWTP
jgi:hypothetical protein